MLGEKTYLTASKSCEFSRTDRAIILIQDTKRRREDGSKYEENFEQGVT